MKIARVGTALSAALIAGAFGPGSFAHAQEYPAKPVRIIVPLAPGGLGDQLTRVIAPKIAPATKQPVIVENRTGGGGIIGAEAAARAAPDGYTLFTGLHNTQAILPHLYAKLPYDGVKDFTPVTLALTSPLILVVHPSVPAKNVKELIALARAKPDSITFGSPGNGTTGHLGTEIIKSAGKVKMVHIPYKGAVPAFTGLLGGEEPG